MLSEWRTTAVAMSKSVYAAIGRKIREIPLEKPVSSYEWEELVQKMCASDDADLQNIGNKEHDVLEQINSKHKKKQE